MQFLANPTVCLMTINLLQMLLLAFLLLPIVDIVKLAKVIKIYYRDFHDNEICQGLALLYSAIIFGYGIIAPLKDLGRLSRQRPATPEQIILRVIGTTDAIKKHLLAGYSLFFLLIIWRLLDYIVFKAKLTEFSRLMGNYHLVDIGFTDEHKESEIKLHTIESCEDQDDQLRWPSLIQLNDAETEIIQNFLETAQVNDTSDTASEVGQDVKKAETENAAVKIKPIEKTKSVSQLVSKISGKIKNVERKTASASQHQKKKKSVGTQTESADKSTNTCSYIDCKCKENNTK